MDEPKSPGEEETPLAFPDASTAVPPSVATDGAASPGDSAKDDDEQPLELPAWVAPAIGIVLVAIASMAVWTGFRPRMRSETRVLTTSAPATTATTTMPEDSGGAPGDPGPGASRVMQNEQGGEVPQASPLPEGELPRATISGDAAGVVPTSSLEVRRGIAFDADRPDAVVYVNDVPIGEARQFESKDQPYEFSQEGSYTIRVVAKDGTESRLVVVATASAVTDVAMIRVRLARP